MLHKDDSHAEWRFPGLDSLYETREKIVQACACIDIDMERDQCIGREIDNEVIEDRGHYSDAIAKVDELIRWIIPEWEHDSERIVNSLTSLTFTRRDAWHCEFDRWECSLDWDGEKFECVKPEVLRPFLSDGDNDDGRPTYGEVNRKEFLTKLNELNVPAWKPRHEPPPDIMVLDGDSWELKLESPDGFILCTGDNGYPCEFDGLCNYLDSICVNAVAKIDEEEGV